MLNQIIKSTLMVFLMLCMMSIIGHNEDKDTLMEPGVDIGHYQHKQSHQLIN